MSESRETLKRKPLFNERGDIETVKRRMIGGNTTNLNDFNNLRYSWVSDWYRQAMNNFWIPEDRITSYNVCYTKLLRTTIPSDMSDQEPLLRIVPQFLADDALSRYIYPVMSRTYYWSDSWEAGLYIALARAGFISVCSEFPDAGFLLLPQIHDRCAVLDWKDRRVSGSTRAALRPERLRAAGARLRITQGIDAVLEGLAACWGEESWFHPPYVGLMRALAASGKSGGAFPGGSFNLFAVELLADVV